MPRTAPKQQIGLQINQDRYPGTRNEPKQQQDVYVDDQLFSLPQVRQSDNRRNRKAEASQRGKRLKKNR